MPSDVHEIPRIWFPEKPPWSEALARLAIGLLFVGIGLALAVSGPLAGHIDWIDADRIGTRAWIAVPIGLLFAAAGGALLWSRTTALIDPRRNRVRGWRSATDTFPVSRPLSEFDTVEARLFPEDDPAPPAYVYVLLLVGPRHDVVLQTFDGAEAAQRRARKLADRLGFRLAEPPPPPGPQFGIRNLAIFSGVYDQGGEASWLNELVSRLRRAMLAAGYRVEGAQVADDSRRLYVTADRLTFLVQLAPTDDEATPNEWYCLVQPRPDSIRNLFKAADTTEHRRVIDTLRPNLDDHPRIASIEWTEDWKRIADTDP
jgi:hypothetical protein